MAAIWHLPFDQWPIADREALAVAFAPGDILDGTAGPGAHLAEGTRKKIVSGYRRWLGFLKCTHPDDLEIQPSHRITRDRVREYVETLQVELSSTSVAMSIDELQYAARLMYPDNEWEWLRSLKSRLMARSQPEDRFERLVPPTLLLDLGFELMEWADTAHDARQRVRDIAYRDGFLIALLSVWPLRRRSIAAMTVSRHVCLDRDGATLLLFPEDTKAKREEDFRMPDFLLPHFRHYLGKVRQRFPGSADHDGLWASIQSRPLGGSQIYAIVRTRVAQRHGKQMSLHDVRRSAATFIATTVPELVGITPGVLQHFSQEVHHKHYNLARSFEASRRQVRAMSMIREQLPIPSLQKRK